MHLAWPPRSEVVCCVRLCCVPVPTAAGEGARGEDLQQGQAGAAFQGPSPAVPDPPLHPEQPPGLPGRAAADAATAGAGHTGAAGAGHSAGAGRGAAAAAAAWTARSHPRVPVPCQEAQANPNSRGSQHQGKQAASSQSGSRIKQSLVSLSPLLPTSQCSWLLNHLCLLRCVAAVQQDKVDLLKLMAIDQSKAAFVSAEAQKLYESMQKTAATSSAPSPTF